MGNWSEKQEIRKEVKEKDKTRRENLGKYFLNLSQLSFVTLVLGMMVKFDWKDDESLFIVILTIIFGMTFTILFAIIGNKIFK